MLHEVAAKDEEADASLQRVQEADAALLVQQVVQQECVAP